MIDKERSKEALHVYLSQLKTSKVSSVQAQEAELELLVVIAETYKQGLIDSHNRTASLAKTAARFVTIVLRYLRTDSELVASGCAAALNALLKHCLCSLADDAALELTFHPLRGRDAYTKRSCWEAKRNRCSNRPRCASANRLSSGATDTKGSFG